MTSIEIQTVMVRATNPSARGLKPSRKHDRLGRSHLDAGSVGVGILTERLL